MDIFIPPFPLSFIRNATQSSREISGIILQAPYSIVADREALIDPERTRSWLRAIPFAGAKELCDTWRMGNIGMLERLGGPESISRIVFALCDRVLASEKLEPLFKSVNMRRLIEHQVKFICSVVGGSDSHTDEELWAAHIELGIDAEAFGEMLSHLRASLEELKIAAADIDAVMTEIEKRQGQIIANGHGSPVA
jgi:hemoglobin